MNYMVVYFTTKHVEAKCERFDELQDAVVRQRKLSERRGFISSVLIDRDGALISSKRCVFITQQAAITCVS